MKVQRLLVMAFVAGLVSAGSAQASTITLSDVFDPIDVLMSGNGSDCDGSNGAVDTVNGTDCKSITYSHTLSGFNSSTDTLDSASLTFTFYDDSLPPENSAPEQYTIVISGATFASGATGINETTAGLPFEVTFAVLGQLSGNPPTLEVVVSNPLQQGNQDFFFAKSVLEASVTRDEQAPPGSVPEPASLLLLGMAASGFVARQVRRRQG